MWTQKRREGRNYFSIVAEKWNWKHKGKFTSINCHLACIGFKYRREWGQCPPLFIKLLFLLLFLCRLVPWNWSVFCLPSLSYPCFYGMNLFIAQYQPTRVYACIRRHRKNKLWEIQSLYLIIVNWRTKLIKSIWNDTFESIFFLS